MGTKILTTQPIGNRSSCALFLISETNRKLSVVSTLRRRSRVSYLKRHKGEHLVDAGSNVRLRT